MLGIQWILAGELDRPTEFVLDHTTAIRAILRRDKTILFARVTVCRIWR